MSDEATTPEPEGSEGSASNGGSVDPAARIKELENELRDAVTRRKNAAAKADEFKGRAEKLEQELASTREGYETKLAGFESDLAAAKGALTKKDFAEAVLAGVPHQTRAQAELTLAGLISVEGIDPTKTDDWKDLAKQTAEALQQRAPQLFQSQEAPQSSGGGSQTPPGAKDWGRYTDLSQVPKEMYQHIPRAEWERLKRGQSDKLPGFG